MEHATRRQRHPLAGLTGWTVWCGLVLAVLGLLAAAPAQSARSAKDDPSGEDDWRFEEEYAKRHPGRSAKGGLSGGFRGGGPLPPPAAASRARPAYSGAPRLGLSTGGAKDIGNFRENLAQGFLPQPSAVTYEGLFYDYFFDTSGTCGAQELFCPAYTTAVSDDPFTGKPEYYLSVGLGSGRLASDFRRKKLNLMLVLDISGSMSGSFSRYYYDKGTRGSGPKAADADQAKTKLAAAQESLIALLDHLGPEDRFGLVLFDNFAYTALTLRPVAVRDMRAIKGHIRELTPLGGTNLGAGLTLATRLMEPAKDSAPGQYENRVIVMTDAMPNLGNTDDKAFLERIRNNTRARLYTTVIGIGVDFNTELTERITKARGANSYSVHSPAEFRKRLDTEFDCLVTPLVFDLALNFQSAGYAIDAVYGSPEADRSTGTLLRVNTLFPSPTTEEGARGGLVLLRLSRTGHDPSITLTARYEDRAGQRLTTTRTLSFSPSPGESYGSPSIRKGIVLARYAGLLRDWLEVARGSGPPEDRPVVAAGPNRRPRPLGQWERPSTRLRVSPAEHARFVTFRRYFEKEMPACQDPSLSREKDVLDRLIRGSAAGTKGS